MLCCHTYISYTQCVDCCDARRYTNIWQEWQIKLSGHHIAQMPWDPKPVPQSAAAPPAHPSNATNLPSSSYSTYDTATGNAGNGVRVKAESGSEHQYNGYAPQGPQGGIARAQQLVQQQYGSTANASINAMQRGGGGLALPGQQQPHARPQGLQLPGQTQQNQQQALQQQQAAMQRQQQQQQLYHQQQQQPRIKMENNSPQLAQGSLQPNYSQTDGSDDALEQWQTLLAERRAITAERRQQADRMMHDHILQHSAELQSGLMLPLDELPSSKRQRRAQAAASSSNSKQARRDIPQMDGAVDKDEDDEKVDVKDEDDENAINSDLDDPDEEGPNGMGDEDDDKIDSILCTYDKVQRVKNKWKCTLKDGVMKVGPREWVFHKGTGEFEW